MKKALIIITLFLLFIVSSNLVVLAAKNTESTSTHLNFFKLFSAKIMSFFNFGVFRKNQTITTSTSTINSAVPSTSTTQLSPTLTTSSLSNKTNNDDSKKAIEKLKKEIEDLKTNQSKIQINSANTAPNSTLSSASTTPTSTSANLELRIISLNIVMNFESAYIEWEVNFPADSKIFFWKDGDSQKNFSQSLTGISLTHIVDLKNLLPATKYCFQIQAVSENGVTTKENCFFTKGSSEISEWVKSLINLNNWRYKSSCSYFKDTEQKEMCEVYLEIKNNRYSDTILNTSGVNSETIPYSGGPFP